MVKSSSPGTPSEKSCPASFARTEATTVEQLPKTRNIWEQLPHPALILAPMEGVTDAIFRQVIARAGRPDLFFTEFTNVSSFASEKGRANALERLTVVPSDPPIIAQIWGKNPEHFAFTAASIEKLNFAANSAATSDPKHDFPDSAADHPVRPLGFAGIDLNFGCPDRHVIKAGGGSAMILSPDLARQCLAATMHATHLPVSVKTRLGYSAVEEFRTWLPELLSAHPAALTIHLRTKKEMSKVPAHYELIPEILALRAALSPETKLILNGDIRDRTAALALAQRFPAADGFMIGRGVFRNPCCFRPGNAVTSVDSAASAISTPSSRTAATTGTITPARSASDISTYQPSRAELLDLLNFHLNLFEAAAAARPLSFEPLKRFFKIYINHFPGAADLRAQMMQTHSVPEVRAILANQPRK